MLSWRVEYLEPVVILFLFTFFYLIYHYKLLDFFIKKFPFGKAQDKSFEQVGSVFLHRASGVLLFGILPGIIIRIILKKTPLQYGFSLSIPPLLLLLVFGICVLLFPILFIYSKGSEARKNTPQARPEKWSPDLIIVNCLTLGLYLIAYELYIRGYILFSLERAMGSWPAIMVMTSIYTVIHLPRGRGETAGSAVMGILFGMLTLAAKSVFISVLIHVYIAFTMDLLIIVRLRGKEKV
jgi:membrane protease YdiL (CAAX protease family)